MKCVYIISVLLLLLGCDQPSDSKQMQNQIDSLQSQLDNSYKPGFGEFMSSIQVHHNKLWFAGLNQNWRLADFEVDEIRESIDAIKQYCKDRPETQSLPMIDPPLVNIGKAIQQQNSAVFKKAYISLTNTCNACHQATKHEFNEIVVPSQPPFSNQNFKLHHEK